MCDRLIYRAGFGNQLFEIGCNNEDAYRLAQLLFSDFPVTNSCHHPKRFDILSVGQQPMLSLWDGEKRLYFGTSRYQLAYILMNEVIYHCINDNDYHHALHAGAVSKDDHCILLPGSSGNGKSTLTSWLIANGYQYLTDELVFLSNEGLVTPLTRPINLKVTDGHETWLVSEEDREEVISDQNGSMIPHRLLNPDFSAIQPRATHIVFPEFSRESKVKLEELSPARSCLYLMQSHVNARNLDGHGVPDLSDIVRRCKSYKLTYSSFDDLESVFFTSSGLFK